MKKTKNSEEVARDAQVLITNALIGLIVAFSASVILNLLFLDLPQSVNTSIWDILINVVVSLSTVVSIVFMIFGGFKYINASNADKTNNNVDQKNKTSIKQQYPRLSIIGILQVKKTNELLLGIALFLLGVASEILFSQLLNQPSNDIVLIVFLLMSILLLIRRLIFDYRVKNGLYGTNEREAREIIAFIIKESEKIDFTDGGKRKNIIGDEDLEEIREQIKKLIPNTTFNF